MTDIHSPTPTRYIHPQSIAANKPINDNESDNNSRDSKNNTRTIHFPLNYKGILLTPQPRAVLIQSTAEEKSCDTDEMIDSLNQEQIETYVKPQYKKISSDTVAHINNGSLHHTHTSHNNLHTSPLQYPVSYQSNTAYESQLLEYIHDYRLQYITLFPQRKPLLYTCQNECNVTKSINTYIKPVLLPYTQICDIQSAAQLVSDIITYKLLQPPFELPVSINTSFTCIQHQSCNSLEQSILLCSILLGMNYDAYVVSGYAKQAVCNNDQSDLICKALLNINAPVDTPSIEFGSYTKLIQPQFNSKFQHNRIVQSKLDQIQSQNQADQLHRDHILAERHVADPYENHRIHFWILVLPDSTHTDVTQPLFIECSTGEIIHTGETVRYGYTGIESVFNHTQYYINMKHTQAVTELTYEFSELKQWECMIGLYCTNQPVNNKNDNVIDNNTKSTIDINIHNINVNAINWITSPVITKQLIEYRYTTQTKYIKYNGCDVYYYNKYVQPDSAIKRYVVYARDKLQFPTTTIDSIHTEYYNRKDQLCHSSDRQLQQSKLYTFHTGLTSGLHTYESTPLCDTYIFYNNTRIDRLIKRVCMKKSPVSTITEVYDGRTDRLQQRVLTITNDSTQHELHTIQLNYSNIYSITILSINELYERDISIVDPLYDVSSVTYDLVNNAIHIKSHHISTLLHSSLQSNTQQQKQQSLKNLKHTIKEHELSVYDIHCTIQSMINVSPDTVVPLVKTMNEQIDDQLMNGSTTDGDSNKTNTIQSIDYLRVFIDKYIPATQHTPWTNTQKQSVRDTALSVYKQTLLDRANIINEHIDTIKQQLSTVTQLYKRNVNSTVNQNEITELQFQLNVLYDRKEQYEQAVLKKYIAYDQKLSQDSRLQMT